MELRTVIAHLKQWVRDELTGAVKVNFFKGGISNINLSRSVKEDTTLNKGDLNGKHQGTAKSND